MTRRSKREIESEIDDRETETPAATLGRPEPLSDEEKEYLSDVMGPADEREHLTREEYEQAQRDLRRLHEKFHGMTLEERIEEWTKARS